MSHAAVQKHVFVDTDTVCVDGKPVVRVVVNHVCCSDNA